jgi:hypothetical protein
MATATSTSEQREARDEKSSKSQIVVVDLDEAQPALQVKRLRKGRGKLLKRVEKIMGDLVEAGTVKSTAQPVVIVVRELPSSPFGAFGGFGGFGGSRDEDDDDDD